MNRRRGWTSGAGSGFSPSASAWPSRQHHMCIGAGEAERADPDIPDRARRQRGRDDNRHATEIDMRVQRAEMQAGRHRLSAQHHHRLDKAGDTGGGLGMTDIGLYRTTGARASGRRTPRPARASRSDRRVPCRCRELRCNPPASGDTPPLARAVRITACCAAPFGAVRPALRPSWLTAVPRITARTRSPSASASDNNFSTTMPQPSPRTKPLARRRTPCNARQGTACATAPARSSCRRPAPG